MIKQLLRRADVFLVFRVFGIFVSGVVLLCIGFFLAYYIEPRAELENDQLDVINTYWSRNISSSGAGPPNFKAEVVLPNGNSYEFTTQPNLISNGRVCAAIQLGKWFNAYHIQILHPNNCN